MKNFLLATALLFCTSISLNAQTILVSPQNERIPKNFIKTNITSIFIKNYSIQYERVLGKSISFSLSYRYMPNTTMPFKNQIIKNMGSDNSDAQDVINNLTTNNYAITPEIRFYLGKKGYGRGFYIAPFYRYANYSAENIIINYTNEDTGEESLTLDGNITANSGGFMLGAQWALSKFICLDWWILGLHYGVSSGEMNGIPSQTLTPEDQITVRENMEDIDIPMVKKTVVVGANKATMIFDGPWAGLRAGISIGIRF